MNAPVQEDLKGLYARLESTREPFLDRARACAALTIPSLVPPKGHNAHSRLPTPYQSLGSTGVNSVTSKLALAILPPNQPSFKHVMDESTREALGAKVGEVEKTLATMEGIVVDDFESTAARPAVITALKHLVVGGNVLVYETPERAIRVFPLTHFVVQRDPQGTWFKIVVKEQIAPDSVPEQIRAVVAAEASKAAKGNDKTYELYTGIFRVGNRVRVRQEIFGVPVPGSEGDYPADKCPWNPSRLIAVENEDYGRGYVEEFIGDLKSLEVLTKSMVHTAAATAKLVIMVSPNGSTAAEDIENAEGGDVIIGTAEDVSTLQIQKSQDLSFVENRIQRLTESLSRAFLLNSAIQRQAERVTAEEIRFMAQELDTQLGGIYSMLAVDFHLPMVRVRVASLERARKLPQLPKGVVRLAITTGIDAIGRGHDFDKLRAYVGFLAEALGPQKVAEVLDSQELADRAAAAMGIQRDGLIRSANDIRAEQERQQQMAMQQAAVAPAINQAGQLARSAQAPVQ